VGVVMVLVQGVALPRLLRRLGEVRLVLAGLASAMLAYLGYGLATAGWVALVIICFNLLAGAVGPTLQGIVSRSVDAHEQGRAMGALASLGSLMAVIAPLIGTPLLAQVSHLPPQDWRVGGVLLLAAALQALALGLAAWHFRHHPVHRAVPPGA
jgi:DHA1 family tetracycline resistance protein-like MFS transporter